MAENDLKKEDNRKKKDDSQGKEDEGNTKKGFPSWLKWVLIGLVVIIVEGGAFFLTKYIIMPKYFSRKVNQVLDEKTLEDKKEEREFGYIYNVKQITVNSKGSKGRRFILTEFAIEASDKDVIEEIKKRDPQIRNDIITFLRQHTVNQVLVPSFQGTSKTYLKTVINSRLNSGEIDSIYFTQLIVQ